MAEIMVRTLYGRDNREPLVEIEMPSVLIQLRPEEVRSLVDNLLNAASASETDGFLVEFFRDNLELDMEQIAMVLSEFRQWREARLGGRPETARKHGQRIADEPNPA